MDRKQGEVLTKKGATPFTLMERLALTINKKTLSFSYYKKKKKTPAVYTIKYLSIKTAVITSFIINKEHRKEKKEEIVNVNLT